MRGKFLQSFAGVLGFLLLPMVAGAQNYSISWYKVSGGGGTSTGGNYAVSGTIGQADAGHMSGGNYTLDGGFWALVAPIQMPGAPLLTITLSNQVALISWPVASGSFALQQNLSLAQPASWSSTVPLSSNVVNGMNVVTVPVSGGPLFFRLKQ